MMILWVLNNANYTNSWTKKEDKAANEMPKSQM